MFGFISLKKHKENISKIKEDFFNQKLRYENDRKESRLLIKQYELEHFLNKFVIIVPNEMENLRVGYGLNINYFNNGDPLLSYYDIVKNKIMISMCINFVYTEQKFNALNKLDPNERIALFYHKEFEGAIDKSATKDKEEEIEDNEVWASKIKKAMEEFKNNELYKK